VLQRNIRGIGVFSDAPRGLAIPGTTDGRGPILAKSKPYGGKSAHFAVELEGGNLVGRLPSGRFKATYYKPPGRPHLILSERTNTDDDELLADAFQAAVAKARELGWIV
jgi:hypothetical protein